MEMERESLKQQQRVRSTAKFQSKPASRDAFILAAKANSPATTDVTSASEGDATPRLRTSTRARGARVLRRSSTAYEIGIPVSDATTQLDQSSSDNFAMPSPSPYQRPADLRKRSYSQVELAASDTEADIPANDRSKHMPRKQAQPASRPGLEEDVITAAEAEQRDKEAIRKAQGLRGRVSRRF